MHRSAYSVYVLKGSRERKNSCKSERETAVRVEKAAVRVERKSSCEGGRKTAVRLQNSCNKTYREVHVENERCQ